MDEIRLIFFTNLFFSQLNSRSIRQFSRIRIYENISALKILLLIDASYECKN